MKFLLSLMMMVMLTLGSVDAEAKRLGGGKSMGQQSSNVTQREATKPAAAPGATPNAAPAAAPAGSRWGGMLGGLAAGLGLAWLASSLGLGEALGQFMMFALLAAVLMVVVGMVLRARAKKQAAAAPAPASSPFAFGGAGAGAAPVTPRSYNADHIGNDASARPWERNSMAFDARQTAAAGGGSMIGSALGGSQSWGVPADFDTAGFITAAKRNFVSLQDAWDRSDIPALRAMMTDSMLAEIRSQLAEREQQAPGQPNKTEVVAVEAQLLGIEELNDAYMASVEFNGMIRENAAGPSPFREVWNMTKLKSGGGWLVAGVQALQ